MREQISNLWKNLKNGQKVTLIMIFVAAFAGILFLCSAGTTSFKTPLFTAPIGDKDVISRISIRLDRAGVEHSLRDGMIFVNDKESAGKMVALLVREDLVPKEASPWDVFRMDRWTTTDFERNVNLRRAITEGLENHIESLDDIDKAGITLVMPEKELFSEDQKEVTASIILTVRPGSDFIYNRKKIEGIIKLVKFAVEGLETENITICDTAGNVLSDLSALPVPPQGMQITEPEQTEIIKESNTLFFIGEFGVGYNHIYMALGAVAVIVIAVFAVRGIRKKKDEALLADARKIASENPEEVARLIKMWLSEG